MRPMCCHFLEVVGVYFGLVSGNMDLSKAMFYSCYCRRRRRRRHRLPSPPTRLTRSLPFSSAAKEGTAVPEREQANARVG